MATLLIPNTPDVAYSQQKTRLGGRDFVLAFAFNEREDRWYLSIFDDAQVPLAVGIKLVCNYPLLRHYRYNEDLPPGEFMAVDLTGDGSPPKFNELGEGRRVELTYWEAETAAALAPKREEVRPPVAVYIAIAVEPNGGYPGDGPFRQAAAGKLNQRYRNAGIVAPADVETYLPGLAELGISSATVTGLGFNASPTGTDPLTSDSGFGFAAGRIAVTT